MDQALQNWNEGTPDSMNRLSPKLGLRRRLARLALALGLVSIVWACNAPFIPVPPPGQTASFTSELVTDGMGIQKTVWTAHGPANTDAAFSRFFVFNTGRGAGVITLAGADGSYTAPPFDGAEGDRVEIVYERPSGERSVPACFLLALGAMAPLCPP
jgi:hypothetical protein